MWLPKCLKKHIASKKREHYVRHLNYAMRRLREPYHNDIDDRDRKYRFEAVQWLYLYYIGDSDFIADGPPETKLKKILSKPIIDVTLRDHVYTKIFYYWKEHKRVEGF